MTDNAQGNLLAAANMLNQTATSAYSMAQGQWQKAFAENERDYTRAWNEEQRDYNRDFIRKQQLYEQNWQADERDYTRQWAENDRDYQRAFAENERAYSRENDLYNRAWNEEQRDYLRQLQETLFNREDNAYQRTVKDLEAAGLSKALISGTNGAGSVISQPSPISYGTSSSGRSSGYSGVGHSNVGAPSPISYARGSAPNLPVPSGIDVLGAMNNGLAYSKSLSEKKRLANLVNIDKMNAITNWTDAVAENPFLNLHTDGNKITNISTDVDAVKDYQESVRNRLIWEQYAKQKKAEYIAEHPDGISNYQMGQDVIDLIMSLVKMFK